MKTKCKVVPVLLGGNWGFAYAVNRGVEQAGGKYILISNFDVEYAPRAVEEMVRVLEENPSLAGVAPKTLLMGQALNYIDNVGSLINPDFLAFNMGIGQLDLGQYDHSEAVFGLCFAAALVRRHAFSVVGPLDEDYFMYYEDVDWCYRANLLGLGFRTAPKAIVYHHHSAATRRLPYSFKYELIQLNLLRTLIKSIASRKLLIRMILRVVLSHLEMMIVRRIWIRATLRILGKLLVSLPGTIRKRREIQKYRVVSDQAIWRLSIGEQPFFDPVSYTPIISPDALLVMFKRRYLVSGQKRDLRFAANLEKFLVRLRESKTQYESEILKRELLEIVEEDLEKEDLDAVRDYVASLSTPP
jgi:GT2 family glycosyltransferase